jgi:hypothetical protein
MKRLIAIVAGTVALGALAPVFAGPDWQAIEQARKNHRTQVAQMEKLTPDEKCATQHLALPLDHGPRAASTPYLNEQRKANFATELKTCEEAAAKGHGR